MPSYSTILKGLVALAPFAAAAPAQMAVRSGSTSAEMAMSTPAAPAAAAAAAPGGGLTDVDILNL